MTVSGKVDRPLGSRHSEHPETIYPVNYGWVEGIIASDGEAQDVYILGADEAISEFSGKIIAVYERLDDAEDKWIVSLDGREYSDEEILGAICFQEQFFKGRLTRGYMSLQNE
ncbi:MAG: inorganic pyrophosphatase [Oscillospiraceae bacterium]|nr:inorganic pyrophosphatase [Oscillospiraceae bacterium]